MDHTFASRRARRSNDAYSGHRALRCSDDVERELNAARPEPVMLLWSTSDSAEGNDVGIECNGFIGRRLVSLCKDVMESLEWLPWSEDTRSDGVNVLLDVFELKEFVTCFNCGGIEFIER